MAVRYDPSLHRWHPMSLAEVRPLLTDPTLRVWLSGGIGLDAWLGFTSREHGDIDLSVRRTHWDRFVRTLPAGLIPHAAEAGFLRPLVAGESPPSNIWCLDRDTDLWVLQVNIEPGSEDEWIYRRCATVRLPWDRATVRVNGLPVAAPEVQLLWKSTTPTAKDEADWAIIRPRLSEPAIAWLGDAIQTAHPRSPWATRI